MLKKPCPYQGVHRSTSFLLRARLKENTEESPKDKDDNDKEDGFPKVKNCFSMFRGRAAHLTMSQRKCKFQEVCVVSTTTPTYLKWSDNAITFDCNDHLKQIPNPESYPLIVDPIIVETHLTKVLMDGGSGLNILYTETLSLMAISKSRLRANTLPFHSVVPRH